MAKIRGSVGTTRGFLNSVNKWTNETEDRQETAFQNGLLDFYDALAKETPVDTGNLRNSLVAHKGGDASIVTGAGNTSSEIATRSGYNQSIATIMGAKIGDRISFVYHATYARRLNNGFTGFDRLGRFYNQPGRFWIERVGSRYRSIMRAAATRLKMQFK